MRGSEVLKPDEIKIELSQQQVSIKISSLGLFVFFCFFMIEQINVQMLSGILISVDNNYSNSKFCKFQLKATRIAILLGSRQVNAFSYGTCYKLNKSANHK